jgi:hypothetical protein
MTFTHDELRAEIDTLLRRLAAGRQVLVAHDKLWPDKPLDADPEISGYLAAMLDYGDVRVCPSPDAHRASWKYVGAGSYICEACRKIKVVACKF